MLSMRKGSGEAANYSRARCALLASTACVGTAAFLLAVTGLLTTTQPVLADGGSGGGAVAPGAGGTGFTGNPGGNGGVISGGGGGGAGGGAGGSGGNGTAAGGLGGTVGSKDGQNGADGTAGGAGGGGGGFNGNGAGAGSISNAFGTIAGGNGGAGGDGLPGGGSGGGGGGGAGGYGAIITGNIGVSQNGGTISGGAGGAGGPSQGRPGQGGDGGVGVQFTNAGASLFNIGTISGGVGGAGGASTFNAIGAAGQGGAGGAGIVGTGVTIINFTGGSIIAGNGGNAGAGTGDPAAGGAGGTGIVGSNLTVINSAIITRGTGGTGSQGGATGAAGNAITFTGGTNSLELQFGSNITGNVVAFSNADTFRLGGNTAASFNVSAIGAAAQYQGFGNFEKTGTSQWVLTNTTTAVTPWKITAGSLFITADGALGAVSGGVTLNGGTLETGLSFTSNRTVTLTANSVINVDPGTTLGLTGLVTGGSTLTKIGTGTLALSGANNYSGTVLGAGTIQVGNNAALGAGGLAMANGTTLQSGAAGLALANNVTIAVTGTVDTNGNAMTLSGVVSETIVGSTLAKTGAGTLILTGTNSYTGATTVNAGTLSVNGSIASSSLTTVNAGATLGGNGTVGNTTVNAGGTLAPGNSIGLLTVQGSLVFAAASSYLVEVSPANADRTNVTGTATLGGATVKANFAAGTYVAKQYTIINAAGGVSGTFSSLVNTNLPGGFTPSLSYDGNNAFLNLALTFVPPPGTGLSGNQQNVGNAIVNFFNTTGGIPIVFGGLTPAGLTQISGETATGSQQTTFDAMNQFMGVMTDPFIAGRGDPISAGGNPNAYADESLAYAAKRKPSDALAAIYTKAPPPVRTFEQRWSVWAAGFGGSQRTDGNTVLGSNDTRSSINGGAVGADYRISPNTLAGFAMAGGGTNFSVNGFGSGRSDLFQAGAFVRHNIGPAYLTGALAYGWQDITTDRTVTVAGIDRLRAQFNANAWSGRLEGGYRFVNQGFGWTPYAAAQFTTFELPNYAEQAIVGSNQFALAYTSKSVTDTRTELGLRTDKSFAVQNGIFTLRGRAAWAHDYNPDRAIGATFQTLPGASFVVNGARRAPDSALLTGSAEMKWINGWSAAATFEGEFSNVTQSYAGKGVVRYAW